MKPNKGEALKWLLVATSLGGAEAAKLAEELTKGMDAASVEAARANAQAQLSQFQPGATITAATKAEPPPVAEPVAAPTPPAEPVAKPAVEAVQIATPAAPAANPPLTETDVALAKLQAELAASPTNHQVALKLAGAQLQAGQTNQAVEVLTRVVDSHAADKDAAGLTDLAALLGAAGALHPQEAVLEKQVKLQPKNPQLWYDLAITRAQLKCEPESLMALKTALALNRKGLFKSAPGRDLVAAARVEKAFDALRGSAAFQKLVPREK